MAVERSQLIQGVKRGDALALDQLLVDCRADVRRYALRHCATSEIDDAVQETLLVVARHVTSLRAAASFASWLFTVVRRECQRLSRKMLAHENIEDEKFEAWFASAPTAELRAELACALESLPAHYLEIVLLRDFEELTISEIVDRLNIPLATAKSRLRRARALVRDYLIGSDENEFTR